ncbi:hypothetical protein E8E14_000647 [Neopestalotiopsis sp. 37M]|nr:hypothetical protein E8E14_000647 [Neopestalotiopsis sp. 37M]
MAESSQIFDLDSSMVGSYMADSGYASLLSSTRSFKPLKGSTMHDSGYASLLSSTRSIRPSKGDPKPHGKSFRSSRVDVKGKGKDLDIQSVDLPAADYDASSSTEHAGLDLKDVAQTTPAMSSVAYSMQPRTPGIRNDAKLDDNELFDLPQTYQDVAALYGKVGESSSSSAPMRGLSPYEHAELDEQWDEVPELPRLLSHPRPSKSRTLSEDMPYNEDCSQYTIQKSRNFTFGTVFKVMWSEPIGNSRLSKHNKDPVGSGISISEFGLRNIGDATLYEGIRRFIVIDGNENGARNGNSICVPIATYKRQGCTKHGVNPQDHGIIYTHDKMPMLLNGEPDLGVSPIRLVVNRSLEGFEKLAPESRINYQKHVTIEHSSLVCIIGRIHQEDRDTLAEGVDANWERRVRERKKGKKQPKAARGEKHISYRSSEKTSRSAEKPAKLPERHGPDRMRPEGHQPDLKSDEHSGSRPRPIPSSPDHHLGQAPKDGDNSVLFETVLRKSTGIHQKLQQPHMSADSHVTISDTQDSQEELDSRRDSRLDSFTISDNVTHSKSSHAEGAKVYGTVGTSLPNSSQSPGSSICLTETPSETSARGPHLTRSQKRLILASSLISYVTFLFETQTRSQGEDSQGEKSQSTHSSLNTGQSIAPNRKRKLSHHAKGKETDENESSEEESDEEEESLNRAGKGKEKEPQPLFACPYVKREGPKALCVNRGRRTVARVKEHLYKHHLRAIHCPRCYITFGDQDALDTHLRQPVQLQCASSDEATNKAKLGGFDKRQEKDLRSRKGLCKMTEYEKWRKIYVILFPDEHDHIPSPYFDPNDSHKLLGKLNENQRLELKQLFCHAAKRLKAKHGEGYGSELKPEFIEELVDEALAEDKDEVLDGAEDGPCGGDLSDAYNEHYNGEGSGVTAKDSSVQFSCQEETSAVEPLWDLASDDYTNEPFWSSWLEEDNFQNFIAEESIPSILLTPGLGDPGTGSMAGAPSYPQDTGVDEHTSDSGYSSRKSQGAQKRVSEDGDVGCSR